jgi:hypothetical protein
MLFAGMLGFSPTMVRDRVRVLTLACRVNRIGIKAREAKRLPFL